MNAATVTTTQILAILPTDPEKLFSAPSEIEAEYRALAKRFHPDMPGGDTEAFARLNTLHDAAQKRAVEGVWRVPGLVQLLGTDGILRRVRFSKAWDMGLGTGYIGDAFLTYALKDDYTDLLEDAVQTIKERMIKGLKVLEDKLSQRLPQIKARFATVDSAVIVLHKQSSLIRLSDAQEALGGTVDPRHVAWIISELLNICCYLEWAGLVHNDISRDTVFIDPETHTACLLGGWWHAGAVGSRMARVQTGRTVANLPNVVARTKIAQHMTDLALLRLTASELLGNVTIPDALSVWLKMASSGSARKDYRDWQDVLIASFGPRKFVKLELNAQGVYKNG